MQTHNEGYAAIAQESVGLQKKVADWAKTALPREANHLKKFEEEARELLDHPDSPDEMADVLLALMLHAESRGVDLLGAGLAKLKVLGTRTYGPCDERGVTRHIKPC